MITEQTLPSLSPTMEEGTLVAWHVKKGDHVEEGQVIAEVQTDKAVVEWEALEGGYVAELIIEAGTQAKVNAVAAIFTSKEDEDIGDAVEQAQAKNRELAGGGDSDDDAADNKDESASQDSGKSTPDQDAPPMPSRKPSAPAPSPSSAPLGKGKRVSPVAARMAAASGIDLAQINGTGADGRIVKVDIQAAIDGGYARVGSGGGAAPAKPKLKLTRKDGQSEKAGLSQMRQVIGKRLLQSKTEIPHFYVTECIDASALVDLRSQLTAFAGVKVTFNDLVTRACALALRQHPTVNSTFHKDHIVKHDSADISIAVAIPDGLITPIIFAAHTLSVSEIGAKVRELSGKAKEGSLQPKEFEGGTFTISNLGMFGIEAFNAIINPPQSAILAVGGIKDEPVIRDGAVVPGKTMRFTLSCDHRVVDGADAAAFLRDLRQLLERPAALLLS
ncbi:MAG: pyruvate dehydrogenase complex dihydrolipoamide acetyltransferase [Planctomycetota bacterium]|nr:MAG: pyruvate dehydrogenase complex dihydrolipoamide acetyltransferase [Planctomycetota bacterium]